MDLVMSVCDEIHVLDFGAVIASGAAGRDPHRPARCSRPTSATPTTADDDETRTDLQPVEATASIPAVTA